MNKMAATWANVNRGAKVHVVVSSTPSTPSIATAVMILAKESENDHAVTGTAYTARDNYHLGPSRSGHVRDQPGEHHHQGPRRATGQ